MGLIRKAKNVIARDPKTKFYQNSLLERTEWWYSWCHPFPNLYFARIRIFSNRSADVRFQDETKVYGFASEDSAANYVSVDEFSRLNGLDAADRKDLEIPDNFVIDEPKWHDPHDLDFEYFGNY